MWRGKVEGKCRARPGFGREVGRVFGARLPAPFAVGFPQFQTKGGFAAARTGGLFRLADGGKRPALYRLA